MSASDDGGDAGSNRKKTYAPGNTRDDGSYRVGRNRPPEQTRFRVDDGRQRGRRPKGQRNFDTEFQEESLRRITIRENGRERRVTKQRATIIRAFDNALTKGDAKAASLLFSHAVRIGDQRTGRPSDLDRHDDEELNAWLRERLAVIETSQVIDNPEESEAESGDG